MKFYSARLLYIILIDDGRPRRRNEYDQTAVNPDVYREYDRQNFVDTLEDWAWFGNGEPPGWYTGVSPWG